MSQKSFISIVEPPIAAGLSPTDVNKCKWIAVSVIIQCIVVYFGAYTILECLWLPEYGYFEYDKLTRIMYLYDSQYCGHAEESKKSIKEIQLSNNTYGLPVLPIKWRPAIVTVSTRLSAKTRMYIELSLGVHVIWMIGAIIIRIITPRSHNIYILKIILTVTLYLFIFVVLFDVSMAIVYVAHIQQSLTKGMVLRYSGYMDFQLAHPDDFAGWIPIAASILWMRGVFFLCLNIYCCKVLKHIKAKIEKTEVKGRLVHKGYLPIPEAEYYHFKDENVLYYRTGEYKPTTKADMNSF